MIIQQEEKRFNKKPVSPKPYGQESRAVISTQSGFRKRSQLNAEMVSLFL